MSNFPCCDLSVLLASLCILDIGRSILGPEFSKTQTYFLCDWKWYLRWWFGSSQASLVAQGLPSWLKWQRICLQCWISRFNQDLDSIPGLGRCPGVGNGNSLQYSCLENFMDKGAWWATVHEVTTSWT